MEKKDNRLKMGSRLLLLIICNISFISSLSSKMFTMAAAGETPTTENILYIAGEEYGYPIEYYDHIKKEFKGAMPDLLAKISAKTGIRFEYVSFGNDKELMKDLQVDLISYVNRSEKGMEEKISKDKLIMSPVCFTIKTEAEDQNYCLAYTRVLDKNSIQKINDAIISIDQDSKEQILQYNIAEGKDDYIDTYIQLILVIFLVIFILAAIIFFILYKKNQARCRQLNWRDDITGYGNIKLLEENFTNYINDDNRGNYCIISLSLENFNIWEEEHTLSDRKNLLKAVSRLIGEGIQEEDFYARIRGNHFIILMQYVSRAKLPRQVTKKILHKIEAMLKKEESYQALKIVAGVYFLSIKDTSLDEVIRCSVMAKQWSKKNNTIISVFDVIYEERVKVDRELERDVETAVEKKEFIPYFHPNINLDTSEVLNYEVLARWQHPSRGLLFPGQFIPIIKRKNLLTQMDISLFETVCSLLQERARTEQNMIFISFNFTPESLRIEQFAETLAQIAAANQISPRYLGIDITESITTQNRKEIVKKITQLKALGFSVTLDSFGGEYSSFVDLEAYDIDYVKLDRSLLHDLENSKTRLVIKGMVDLCHNIGVKVIGEGIESEEQLNLLRQVSCDAAQGFYFCRPMPFSEIGAADKIPM